jgi:NADP-dependent 3-hydroxy acid dehydrogenase YdfG
VTVQGRDALVTGAGSGIGASIARPLAGASVTLAGRRGAALEAVAAEIGSACLVADGFDVTDRRAVERGLAAARAAFGPVAILVNNAGEAARAPFEKIRDVVWAQVLAIDLTSVFLVTQCARPISNRVRRARGS